MWQPSYKIRKSKKKSHETWDRLRRRAQKVQNGGNAVLNSHVHIYLELTDATFIPPLGRFRFDYDYEIRHFWRQLLASSRADVIKS